MESFVVLRHLVTPRVTALNNPDKLTNDPFILINAKVECNTLLLCRASLRRKMGQKRTGTDTILGTRKSFPLPLPAFCKQNNETYKKIFNFYLKLITVFSLSA